MSCPYFEPCGRLAWERWRGALRPPLGAPQAGVCRAGAESYQPGPDALVESCNMGYASQRCARFRHGQGDAVRFAVVAKGGERTVRWLVEAGGLPVLSGELDVAAVESGACPKDAPPGLGAQLRAYVAAYREAAGESRSSA